MEETPKLCPSCYRHHCLHRRHLQPGPASGGTLLPPKVWVSTAVRWQGQGRAGEARDPGTCGKMTWLAGEGRALQGEWGRQRDKMAKSPSPPALLCLAWSLIQNLLPRALPWFSLSAPGCWTLPCLLDMPKKSLWLHPKQVNSSENRDILGTLESTYFVGWKCGNFPPCIRVPQRSRTKRINVDAGINRDKYIRGHLLQEFVHQIMEDKKFYNLSSASWRPRKAGGVIQSESKGLRIKRLRF